MFLKANKNDYPHPRNVLEVERDLSLSTLPCLAYAVVSCCAYLVDSLLPGFKWAFQMLDEFLPAKFSGFSPDKYLDDRVTILSSLSYGYPSFTPDRLHF